MFAKILSSSAAAVDSAFARRFSQQAGSRVYTAFKIYKPQMALNVTPVPPRLQTRAGKNSLVLSKTGWISIDLAASLSQGYDWKQKKTYLLMSNEIGAILASTDGNATFVREPRAAAEPTVGGTPLANVRRTFSLSADKDKLFYTISVENTTEGQTPAPASIQLTRGEFEVLKTLLAASIPKLFMWEHGFEPVIEASSSPSEPMSF
jgi:hypothetical protein